MTMMKSWKIGRKKVVMQQPALLGRKGRIIMMILMVGCKKEAAIAHIKTLIDKSFTVKHKNKSMIWTVVDEWIPSDASVENKPFLG
jgi:hypothetical protein